MTDIIPIIDLFAGPGGLGEGFSSLTDNEGKNIFQIVMSIEKDEQAHRTLCLRAFVRKISDPKLPKQYLEYIKHPSIAAFASLKEKYPDEWKEACEEALCYTLSEKDDAPIKEAKKRLKNAKNWVLIGGPPCQAYSLVGRSRRTNDKEKLQEDVKQTLYKCYLRFITELKPTVFVMENVKGLLSATLYGDKVFDLIKKDMCEAGYKVYSLSHQRPEGDELSAADYVVRAEEYGIPQARHRVILLGIKNQSEHKPALKNQSEHKPTLLKRQNEITVEGAIDALPRLRSGFSRRGKHPHSITWADHIRSAANKLAEKPECEKFKESLRELSEQRLPSRQKVIRLKKSNDKYADWYRKRLNKSDVLANHEARTHMPSDLDRYLFCAAFAQQFGHAAKLDDFPETLLPNHKNIKKGDDRKHTIFVDRFKVQVKDRPSTTVTSHISKDGHYYIHYDMAQCRSLTVREAARLQTFPDDYFFEGNRTSQYQQVGNAVPPLLAQQIAHVVADYFSIESVTFFDEPAESNLNNI